MRHVGVLALQGDYEAHGRVLSELDVSWQLVKMPRELDAVDSLIIPGGESTTLLKLMAPIAMRPALERFHAQGRPIFGTCAGLILLARETRMPAQESLGLIDIVVERNAYGRQIDSFIGEGTPLVADLEPAPLEMVFIRAPKIAELQASVTPLATCQDVVVLARQDNVLVASFHPELTSDRRVHQYFLDMVSG
ncbi:pyridoxal 5'-phosphate synthase glutaminase subunit PdxT [Candidatus Entotheonella palauensis]|uniref:pyridoxal 5'-phosphate synthase glutaminase subunit PdxT n=1 Tax=Candidatus Entotheonella palauensis TaxID=93172 RepID=UPI000B7FD2A2|nr:pyridoxal 5'-phosphate synthase glutaminase subunit PdxT [Candidatus Entotheonella palauensis]